MTNPFAQSNPFSPMQTQPGANPFAGSQPVQQHNPFAPQAPQGFQQPAFGAPAPGPVNMAGMFGGMGSAEEAGDQLPPLPAGGHKRVKIGEVTIKPSQRPGKTHVIFFRAELTVLESDAAPAGTRATFIEKITGHDYPHYRADSLARIRSLVSSGLGQDDNDPQVRAMYEQNAEQIMQGVVQGALKDKEVAITNVTHKATKPSAQKPQGGLIANYSFGKLGASVALPGPVQAAPVAGFQAPAASFGPVFPPPGWQADGTGHYIGFAGGQQHRVSENDLRSAQAAGKV